MSALIAYFALPAAVRTMIQPAPTHFDRASESDLFFATRNLRTLKEIAKALGINANGVTRKRAIIDLILDANFVHLPADATPHIHLPAGGAVPATPAVGIAPASGALATPALGVVSRQARSRKPGRWAVDDVPSVLTTAIG